MFTMIRIDNNKYIIYVILPCPENGYPSYRFFGDGLGRGAQKLADMSAINIFLLLTPFLTLLVDIYMRKKRIKVWLNEFKKRIIY